MLSNRHIQTGEIMTDYNDPKVKQKIIQGVLKERYLRDNGVIILNDYRKGEQS
jgi:hypothetical protein